MNIDPKELTADQRARQAEHELYLTAEAHAKYRTDCLEQAIKLAGLGKQEEAYRKLLMVVAIDGVRDIVLRKKNDAEIDRAAEANKRLS